MLCAVVSTAFSFQSNIFLGLLLVAHRQHKSCTVFLTLTAVRAGTVSPPAMHKTAETVCFACCLCWICCCASARLFTFAAAAAVAAASSELWCLCRWRTRARQQRRRSAYYREEKEHENVSLVFSSILSHSRFVVFEFLHAKKRQTRQHTHGHGALDDIRLTKMQKQQRKKQK